jgi:hypothetical protein
MQTSRTARMVFAMVVLLWPALSSGASRSTAKVCGYLPISELEAHFGSKAAAFRGDDGRPGQMATCSVDLPDRSHGVSILSDNPKPGGPSVKEHLAAVKEWGGETKKFGSVGCYRDPIAVGDEKMPPTTCFLEGGHFLALTVVTDDPKKLGFELVKHLLEMTAARRK